MKRIKALSFFTGAMGLDIGLKKAGIDVIPMGIKEGKVASIKIVAPFTVQKDIHTISLYLAPQKQDQYLDFILKLKPHLDEVANLDFRYPY